MAVDGQHPEPHTVGSRPEGGNPDRELRRELATARQAATQRRAGERSWTVRGIVRSVLPEFGAVFLTHEAIPGLMEAMTMGFQAQDPKILDGLVPGDQVRFTLEQKGERLLLVAIEKEAQR